MKNTLTLLALSVLLAACAAAPPAVISTPPLAAAEPAPLPGGAPLTPASAFIGAGDEIEVRVPDKAELNQTAKVRDDGAVTLALIGTVRAAGRTAEEIEADVTDRYRALGPPAGSRRADRSYLIALGDLLEIRFANHPELNQTQRVRPDGKISLPIVRTVEAESRTPEALEQDLTQRYARTLKNVELVVIVREYTSNRIQVGGAMARAGFEDLRPQVAVRTRAAMQVFVGGEVAKPGVLAYRTPLTVMGALIEAGGVKPTGEMRSVLVLRKQGTSRPQMIRIDLQKDLSEGTTNDFPLLANDVVVVPKTQIASVVEFLDQYLYQVLPPLRNSSFAFIYNLRERTIEVPQVIQ
jgi:protein involved in polysaccharide export with SLBB domain